MSSQLTRRETLKRGLAAASLLATMDKWTLPAFADEGVDVAFTDYPNTFNAVNPTGANRLLDLRKLDGLITPNDQFFYIQHYNRPEIAADAYRLKLTGMVNKTAEFTLADLKAMKP